MENDRINKCISCDSTNFNYYDEHLTLKLPIYICENCQLNVLGTSQKELDEKIEHFYDEDFWKLIRIGNCELQVVKPCSRCVLTTVDPETGKYSGKEPLRTLATFRKENGKVLFGQNLLATKMGKMEIGMPVEIISKK